MANADNRRHPLYLFRVEIDGIEQARFQKVTGLKLAIEYDEYPEGGSMEVEKDPGRPDYPDITLIRGLTNNLEIYEWFQDVIDSINDGGGEPFDVKKNLDIVQLNRRLEEIARYRVIEAGPKEWDPGDFDAEQKSGYHIETAVLAIRKWYRI